MNLLCFSVFGMVLYEYSAIFFVFWCLFLHNKSIFICILFIFVVFLFRIGLFLLGWGGVLDTLLWEVWCILLFLLFGFGYYFVLFWLKKVLILFVLSEIFIRFAV